MTTTAQPRLRGPGRADHLRNRARILDAARELFAQSSIDNVQLEDVAVAAGIGRATLFRHIGGKDALVAEVYRGRMQDLHGLAARCLAIEDPWAGAEFLLRAMAEWLHEDRGLYDYTCRLVREGNESTDVRELVPDLDRVFERARTAGVLDPRFQVRDVMPLMAFTALNEPARQAYFLDIILRGLRHC